jgi:hypothetical protein
MARSVNPVDMAMGLPRQQLQWAQSLHNVVNGGLDQGVPTGKDSTGNFNTFTQGNANGVLVRVGASGSTGNQYTWSSSNAPLVINHGLVDTNGKPRQPIGVHVVNKNKSLDVYLPVAPNESTITIHPTDATAHATLYIF